VYEAYRSATSPSGANVWNTALLIGWDEPGGTYDHVPPGPVPPPDPAAPPGEFGFTFERSGYRVPAIMVSPWIAPGSVFNEEYRHTSLIATLRKAWGLGAAFSGRDAAARPFDGVFTLEAPRDPGSWATITPLPVPAWTADPQVVAQGLSTLGKGIGHGLIARAKELAVKLPAAFDDPDAPLTPRAIVDGIKEVASHFFPLLSDHADHGDHGDHADRADQG
jgi:phospholipase C